MENNNNDSNTLTGPLRVAYSRGQLKTIKYYDLLVVACDPRNLEGVCDYNNNERVLFDQLQNFTFHTTLIKVPLTKPQEHGVIFAPYALEKMQGSVYGFRNESAKKFGLRFSNTMTENLVTVYQLLGPTSHPYTPDEFARILADELPTLDWWPFGPNFKVVDSLTTPYFDHYSPGNLKAQLPWKLFDLQGQNNTLYVHASTCFESALDCWGYANMLLADGAPARKSLPANKAAKIAILGAGVSGLLFSVKLKNLGYTNIELLESTDRYGGKTHTIKMDGPYPPGYFEPTYCELGTCYMSPSYDNMVADLQKYLVGNSRITFGQGNDGFRAIVTRGQLPPNFKAPLVMGYGKYCLRKAEAELGLEPGRFDDVVAQADLLYDLSKYIVLYRLIFGYETPMPSTPPQEFLNEHASRSFLDWLRYHKLDSLIGILQYGYEVQGYGTLSSISAFYGLVWITPAIIETIIEDEFKYIAPIVTAWSKGWGDVWDQIVAKENLKILYNVKLLSIERNV